MSTETILREIRDDLFFFDEDGNRVVFTGAIAEVRIGDIIGHFTVHVRDTYLLGFHEFREAMLDLAEAAARRKAEDAS